jgi:glycosyltransferase involved in cell wall biosynthesis
MQVYLVSPYVGPSGRGNAVTVERLRAGLESRGVSVRAVLPADCDEPGHHPDLVHAFHAGRAGPAALRLASELRVPLVVTLTGTDFNEGLDEAATVERIRRVLLSAQAVIGFTQGCAEQVVARLPELASTLRVIPQAPLVRGWSRPQELRPRSREDGFTVLHLGGIRPVKDNLFAVAPLQRLRERLPGVRLDFAGPVLDGPYAERLRSRIRGLPWCRHVGELPRAAIPAALAGAEAVLNTSLSEGMSNALLEAMWWGCPVVARDVPGNRELVTHEVTGLLFSDEAGLERCVERLAREPALALRLAGAARALVDERFDPAVELDAHLELYRELLAAPLTQ